MNPRRPMPEGFAERAKEPTRVLTKDFHCTNFQCKRWREELGIHCAGRRQPRPVISYTQSGEKVAQYKSLAEAEIAVCGNASNICAALKGRVPSAYGYLWRYAEE